jgi:hypothetical protein
MQFIILSSLSSHFSVLLTSLLVSQHLPEKRKCSAHVFPGTTTGNIPLTLQDVNFQSALDSSTYKPCEGCLQATGSKNEMYMPYNFFVFLSWKDKRKLALLSQWQTSRLKPVALDARTLKRPIDHFLLIIVGNIFRRGRHYCYVVVCEP